MDSRERIIELVKQGVLSVDEGLDLIESLSDQKADQSEDELVADEATNKNKVKQENKESTIEDFDQLTKQIEQYTVGIDRVNQELAELHSEREALKKEVANRRVEFNQIDLETMTDLDKKEAKERIIKVLDNKIDRLTRDIQQLTTERNKQMKDMYSLRMQQWTDKAKQLTDKIELPEDWRADETIDKAGKFIDSSSRQLADLLQETVEKTKDTIKNIDWEDVKAEFIRNERVSFEHEWLFEETSASLLDFKMATGSIELKPSMNQNIKVSAQVTMVGKMEHATPLEAFEANSIIDLNEERFKFHVPNKKVKADLVVYLPQRQYDRVQIRIFNGTLTVNELLARDIYVNVASGAIELSQVDANMLEVKVKNGDVRLENMHLQDLLLSAENGDLRVDGKINSLETGTINGDVLLTLNGNELVQVTARSVQGNIKVSLPQAISLEIEATTTLGDIQSRLSQTKKSQGKEKQEAVQRFYRLTEAELCRVNLQTVTGNILLKDTTENE